MLLVCSHLEGSLEYFCGVEVISGGCLVEDRHPLLNRSVLGVIEVDCCAMSLSCGEVYAIVAYSAQVICFEVLLNDCRLAHSCLFLVVVNSVTCPGRAIWQYIRH